MGNKRNTLAAQLTGYLGAAIAALVLVFLVVDYHVQKQQIWESTVARMADDAQLLSRFLTEGKPPKEWRQTIQSYCHQMAKCGIEDHQLALVSSDGRMLSTTGMAPGLTRDERLLTRTAVQSGVARTETPLRGKSGKYAAVAVPLRLGEEGPSDSVLLYTEPLTEFDALLGNLFKARVALLFALLLLVILVVYFVLQAKVARPLNALFLHEYDVSKGNLETKDYPDPNNEISEIYDMFNAMIERLQEGEGVPAEHDTGG